MTSLKWYWGNEVSLHPIILVARGADTISWGLIRTRRLKTLRVLLKELRSTGHVDGTKLAKAWFKVHDFAR